jgi:hypothetical protein
VLGEPKILALFSASTVQITVLTVGPIGRRNQRICSMAVVWTPHVSDVRTRRASSIGGTFSDAQRTSVSTTVGRTLGQRQRTLPTGSHKRSWVLRWSQSASSSKALLGSKCTLLLR